MFDVFSRKCDSQCTINSPALADIIVGDRIPYLYWKAILAAMPDLVLLVSEIIFDRATGVVKSTVHLKGTKLYYRQSDLLFLPNVHESPAGITASSSTDNVLSYLWSPSVISSILANIGEFAESTTLISELPNDQNLPVVIIEAHGTQEFHFNTDDVITHIHYNWTMSIEPRHVFDA